LCMIFHVWYDWFVDCTSCHSWFFCIHSFPLLFWIYIFTYLINCIAFLW
jgi:hypothetical protein